MSCSRAIASSSRKMPMSGCSRPRSIARNSRPTTANRPARSSHGNCVNIHLGRFEHPDIYPAHSLPLAHYHVNFPLSAYLSGTEAIHAHPKYPRFNREGGSVYEFTKVEAHFEGEEMIDGLRCVKIRVDRWHYSKEVPGAAIPLAGHRAELLLRQRTGLVAQEHVRRLDPA